MNRFQLVLGVLWLGLAVTYAVTAPVSVWIPPLLAVLLAVDHFLDAIE